MGFSFYSLSQQRLALLLFTILTSLLITACGGLAGDVEIVATVPPQPTRQPIIVDNPEDLGAAVFAQHCTACHGNSGRGDGATARDAGLTPPDFTLRETSADQSLEQWTNTVRYGRIDKLMPPWINSLSDEEIQAVANYTFTLWQTIPETESTENIIEETVITEEIGVVYGEVVVGTTGVAAPDIISVALHILDNEMNEVGFEMQILEDSIDYQFEDILVRSDYTYLLTAIHNDVVFYSETAFGTPQNPAIELPIFIYEVTHDPSVIEIDLLVMRLIPDDEEIIVQQLINFNNTSDYVYRGSNQIDGFTYDSVRIPIPDEATLLNSIELVPRFMILEEAAQQTLLDTQPVFPGSDHLVEIIYSIPFPLNLEGVEIRFPVAYNVTKEIEVLVEPSNYQISGGGFESQGVQHFSTGVFENYLSDPIVADDIIAYYVEVAPAPSVRTTTPSKNNNLALILAASGIGLLAISGVGLLLSMRGEQSPKDDLLTQIADLDNRYESGKLDDEIYHSQRTQLKRRLAEIMQSNESVF